MENFIFEQCCLSLPVLYDILLLYLLRSLNALKFEFAKLYNEGHHKTIFWAWNLSAFLYFSLNFC